MCMKGVGEGATVSYGEAAQTQNGGACMWVCVGVCGCVYAWI